MIKILFLISNLSVGGQERQLIELLKGLTVNKNIECELVIMANTIHYKDFYDLEIPVNYIIRRHRKDITIFFKLFKLCKRIKPDILHSWGPTPASYAFLIAKILKIKFVNSFIRNSFKPKIFDNNWFRSKLTFPFSDVIISNSKAGLKSYGLKNNKKGIVIYNGFDLNRIEHLEDKEIIKNSFSIKTKYVIGMVATFSDKKDYKTFIKAADYVLQKRDDVTFVAVGNGQNLISMKTKINNSNFIFLGNQTNIESIVNIFDIGILTTYTEGISNSIMEYMAFGKSIIATDGGGTKEIVKDGVNGYLIEQKNEDQLSNKIIYLLDHIDVSKKMGDVGKNNIIEEFSLRKMVNRYVELFKKIS